MIHYVPTSTHPETSTHYTQTTSFEGVDYILRFDYLQAQDQWSMSMYTAADRALILGVPIVAGADLLARCRDPERPRGSLFLIPGKSTPSRLELGESRAERLVYVDESGP